MKEQRPVWMQDYAILVIVKKLGTTTRADVTRGTMFFYDQIQRRVKLLVESDVLVEVATKKSSKKMISVGPQFDKRMAELKECIDLGYVFRNA